MKRNGFVTVTCPENLRTNERTIEISVSETAGGRPFLVVEMSPKDFAETVCGHIARPARIEEIKA
jgi:hypothetical protein